MRRRETSATYFVRGGGGPPEGEVGGRVPARPFVVAESEQIAQIQHGDQLSFGTRYLGPIALRLESRHHQRLRSFNSIINTRCHHQKIPQNPAESRRVPPVSEIAPECAGNGRVPCWWMTTSWSERIVSGSGTILTWEESRCR